MKELFANYDAGMIGLLIFFGVFCAAVAWTLRPSARGEYKEHGEIPFREDQKND